MAGIGQWWNSLGQQEKLLIGVGVPVVGVAALASTLKGKRPAVVDEPATAAGETTKFVMTGPPTFDSNAGGSQTFDLYRQLTDYMQDLQTGMGGGSVTAVPSTPNPPVSVSVTSLSSSDLVAECIRTSGSTPTLDELYRRRHTINDPAFGGQTNPTECGRQYALYLLGKGYRPA